LASGETWEPWGKRPLDYVPSPSSAGEIAEMVRAIAKQRAVGPANLSSICTAARAKVQAVNLGARDGLQEAMLVPLAGDRFGISVDPAPPGGWGRTPSHLRTDLRRHRMRFRVGHELGHALFYRRGLETPRRQVFDSPAQEAFCDSFSMNLLVPRSVAARVKASPEAVMRLRASCDVSLELAVRAVASAQPSLAICLWFVDSDQERPVLQWASASAASRIVERPPDPSSNGVTWFTQRRQLLLVR
jgi:hypothetical protein